MDKTIKRSLLVRLSERYRYAKAILAYAKAVPSNLDSLDANVQDSLDWMELHGHSTLVDCYDINCSTRLESDRILGKLAEVLHPTTLKIWLYSYNHLIDMCPRQAILTGKFKELEQAVNAEIARSY